MAATPTNFSATYRRYTAEISDALYRIGTALGAIRSARILPAVEDQLRSSARVGTVHYSNLIEGNELPVIEAERATRGQLAPDTKAKIELVNYVEALDLIDRRLAANSLDLTTQFLRELHGTATRGLGREDDPHFKPRHEGEWRDGIAVVRDHLTGRVMHEGPPAKEVDTRMNGVFEWLSRKIASAEKPFVIAGVMHWAITDIHPFADGNGRAARLFQAGALMKAEVLPGRMLSFERYYGENRSAYYAALRSVRLQTLNMEAWLTYFLEGLAQEYERVATTVSDLSSLASGGSDGPLRLRPAQQAAVTALRIQGLREFTRRDYESAAGVERSAALDDLKELVRHGVIVVRGASSATRYAFAGGVTPASPTRKRGKPETWTETKIETDLRTFLANRTGWPSPGEFSAAGLMPLYTAASRKGGIARWRRMMGL